MGQPYINQQSYRWRDDTTGPNVDSGWAEAKNTALGTVTPVVLNTNYRIRFAEENSGDKDLSSTRELWYNVDSAGWVQVTTSSSYVRIFTTSQYDDGDPVTDSAARLESGTYDEGYCDETGEIASFTLGQSVESENEWCIQFLGGGTSIELQMRSGAGVYNLYSNSPTTLMPDFVINQPHFRIRSGDDYDLGVDNGWAALEDTNATIGRGIIFRILFKLTETGGLTTGAKTYKLQVNREATGWVDIYEWDRAGLISPVCLALSARFADGDAITTELLANDGGTWTDGEAVETVNLDNVTDSITLNDQETEVEWALIIQSTHLNTGSAVVENIAGDELEFRMVESDGTVFSGSYVNPTITVADTARFVGGCFVESPERIGPFKDSNGNLYYVSEATEAGDGNMLHVWKSSDGGDVWRIKTDANAPTSSSAEGESVSVCHYGQTLHILTQGGSREVEYSQFHVSDHATKADLWDNSTTPIISEEVHDPGANPSSDQACGIIVRSDDTVVVVYRTNDGSDDRVTYRIREDTTTSPGVWGTPTSIDTAANTFFTFSGIVLGENDKIHIFYKDSDTVALHHVSLSSVDVLGTKHTLVDADPTPHIDGWSTSPAIYWDNAGTEEVMILTHADTDEKVYSFVISDDDTPDTRKAASDNTVEEHPAGSHQPVVDLVVDPATDIAYMLYADLTTRDIYRDEAENDGGWGTDVEQKDGVHIDFIRGNVFTHSAGNGGAKVYGYFYANSPNDDLEGYTGDVWYGEYELPSAGADVTFAGAAAMSTTTPDVAVLAVDRSFSGAAVLVTTTPTTAMLGVSIPFTGTATLLTTTPDTVLLAISKFFTGTAALLTTTPSVALAVVRTFAGQALLATTTPSAALAVDRSFAGAALLATTTPDGVMLGVSIPFAGASLLATTTPDTVVLAIAKFFVGTSALLTTTPDGVMLGISIPFTGTSILATSTPAIDLLVARSFSGTSALATATPDGVMLAVSIPFSGSALLATTTPDTVLLAIAKFFTGQALLATTTPSITLIADRAFGGTSLLATTTPSITLIADLAFGGTALMATTTPDDVVLEVGGIVTFAGTSLLATTTPAAAIVVVRAFGGSATLLTTTPGAVLSVSIPFTGTSALLTTTPDTVMLSVSIPFSGQSLLATTTPSAILSIAKLFAGTAAMLTTTPIPMLAVDRAFVGQSLLLTVTPDNVELTIAGTITFEGTAAMLTTTPSVLLAVARSFAGQSAMVTTTPSGMLSVAIPFSGAAELATTTPVALLAVDRSFGGQAQMQFTTTDLAILSLILQFAGQAHMQTLTPDDVELLLRVAVGLVDIIVTTRRPGAEVSARRPGVDVTGRS